MTDATYNYLLGDIDEEGFNQEIEKWKEEGGAAVIEEYTEQYQQSNN